MKLSKPELSQKNPYWIEKHRYYELKHFCLQYPIWEEAYAALDGLSKRSECLGKFTKGDVGDPTAKCALAKSFYEERIKMIRFAAESTDDEMAFYILKGATEGMSYEVLCARYHIPCCKDVYYKLYRKFFWILNDLRK